VQVSLFIRDQRLAVECRLTPKFSCKHATTVAAKPHPKSACLLQRVLGIARGQMSWVGSEPGTARAPSVEVCSRFRANCNHPLDPRVDLIYLSRRRRIVAMNHPTPPKGERPFVYFNVPYTGGSETLGKCKSAVLIAHPELKTQHGCLASLKPWTHHNIPVFGCSLLLSGEAVLVLGREGHVFGRCLTPQFCCERSAIKVYCNHSRANSTGGQPNDYHALVCSNYR
jgi:hypothetical protein